MKDRRITSEQVVVIALVLFVLLFRLLTLMMIHTGVDERDYWFAAKRMRLGFSYDVVHHRTIRFAVILPVLAVQALLGTHPNIYYVLPLVLSVAHVVLVYRLGKRLHSQVTGVLAATGLVLFPYMIRGGSQIRPGIFSLTYVLLSFWFFLDYLERADRRRVGLLFSAALMFIAYQSKITNLYFVPGFVLAIFLFGQKRWAEVLLFCGMLLSLYVLETLTLYWLFGEPLGRLGIIAGAHLQGDYITPMSFWELFKRFSPEKLPFYWTAFLVPVLPAAWFLGRWRRSSQIAAAGLLVASFLLGMTFGIKSAFPFVPVEPFIHRYFLAVLGFVLLLDAAFLVELFTRATAGFGSPEIRPRVVVSALSAILALVALFFSVGELPSRFRLYFNDLRDIASHPLALNVEYEAVMNRTLGAGTPIVAVAGNAGQNAIATAIHFFVSDEYLKAMGLPLGRSAIVQGVPVTLLGDLPVNEKDRDVVLATRKPFRLVETGLVDALKQIER